MNEDIELAKRILGGDRGADEELIRSLYQPIFLAMRHLTRSREDAEDLTQQTFILVKQNIGQYRGSSSLKTWAMKIGYREYLRGVKREQRSEVSEHTYIDQQFEEVETANWLLDILSTLAPKQRETFILLEIENMSIREAAEIMRVPTGTVKTRHFHARRALQKKIEQEEQLVRNVVQIHES